ncbi:cell shape-determining protein MreC [Amylibacter marinus]|uniref:Cell shape-determining protein MreC n=1 Tax=Amylibacter marinus TaxID=1475483 RepID=A0ABQ5VY84_9RHOB|nr:rod shape-determining protein MreC [Amylibacter marinus]GLQ36249.1 cell shape-determining protein MreC [Amylibacter marinus]
MARNDSSDVQFLKMLGRLGLGIFLLICFALFMLWRIDNPRAERLRMAVVDRFVPNMDPLMAPVNKLSQMGRDFQSYERIYSQNQELRRELQRMKSWREAAIQLEQENARLLDLNKVKLSPKLSSVSGKVITDSGSRFRQSALINLGREDGMTEGWAAMDGLGLVGRIVAVGEKSSRVVFVSDTSSNIPILIKPSNHRAILAGDNTLQPPLKFVESIAQIQPGDRIITSGDGGVFPSDLLVGQVVLGADGQLRTQLAADFRRLDLLRVIRFAPSAPITEPDRLIGPVLPKDFDQEAVDG